MQERAPRAVVLAAGFRGPREIDVRAHGVVVKAIACRFTVVDAVARLENVATQRALWLAGGAILLSEIRRVVHWPHRVKRHSPLRHFAQSQFFGEQPRSEERRVGKECIARWW